MRSHSRLHGELCMLFVQPPEDSQAIQRVTVSGAACARSLSFWAFQTLVGDVLLYLEGNLYTGQKGTDAPENNCAVITPPKYVCHKTLLPIFIRVRTAGLQYCWHMFRPEERYR